MGQRGLLLPPRDGRPRSSRAVGGPQVGHLAPTATNHLHKFEQVTFGDSSSRHPRNEGNVTLLVVNLRTMTVIESQRVGEVPDVLAFDPQAGRLYVASESGVVSVFIRRGRGLMPVGEVRMPRAHTVSVDSRTHLVYLPLQNLDGHPVLPGCGDRSEVGVDRREGQGPSP